MNQYPEVDMQKTFTKLPIAIEVQPDRKFEKLLEDLSPDTIWRSRQIAARKLGYLRSPEALPWLLDALLVDPFWMVRCTIIQALEVIGDPGAIPTLQDVAKSNSFPVVRSYADKAIERLSQEG